MATDSASLSCATSPRRPRPASASAARRSADSPPNSAGREREPTAPEFTGLFDLRWLRLRFPDIARGRHQLLHVGPRPTARNTAISAPGRLSVGDLTLDASILPHLWPDTGWVRPVHH